MSRDAYCSVPDLRKRGWTPALIARFLPTPDDTWPNPHYRKAAPMKAYLADRVSAIEQSPEFAALRARAEARKRASARGVGTKRAKLAEWVAGLTIPVPVLDRDVLIREACEYYNARGDRRPARRWGDPGAEEEWGEAYVWRPASPGSDPWFLNRIVVNYLRHRLTDYEAVLRRTVGKVGRRAAYAAIKGKVLGAIAGAYPWLAEACRDAADRLAEEGFGDRGAG